MSRGTRIASEAAPARASRPSTAKLFWPKARRRECGGCAVKDRVPLPGEIAPCGCFAKQRRSQRPTLVGARSQQGENLKTERPDIREKLLDGSYRPEPVRRVGIPKPGDGTRELGIPTVVDRLIQPALLQVLQPLIAPIFSEHSHDFRPGQSAHGAVLEAPQYVQAGYAIAVDVDLEKFFDRINHGILMDRLAMPIADKRVLRLTRRYLQAGIVAHGVYSERFEGPPQGGPLSPLLANVLLDEVDRELERRGHRFVRCADDCALGARRQTDLGAKAD